MCGVLGKEHFAFYASSGSVEGIASQRCFSLAIYGKPVFSMVGSSTACPQFQRLLIPRISRSRLERSWVQAGSQRSQLMLLLQLLFNVSGKKQGIITIDLDKGGGEMTVKAGSQFITAMLLPSHARLNFCRSSPPLKDIIMDVSRRQTPCAAAELIPLPTILSVLHSLRSL